MGRIVWILLCWVMLVSAAPAKDLKVVEAHVNLIDTGLTRSVTSAILFDPVGIWIDGNRIAIDAMPQNGTDEEKRRFGSVMLYDLRTQKTKGVEPKADPVSWDDTTNELVVRHIENSNKLRKEPWPVTLIKIDRNGDVLERTPLPESWFSWTAWAERAGIPKEHVQDRWRMRLEKAYGYIESGENKEAILHKPDGTLKKLGISSNSINKNRYLPFLNTYEIGASSCYLQGDKCPPEILLMSTSGDIETVSLPKEILSAIPMVSGAFIVKDGVLITVHHPEVTGMFLWRKGLLYELWRASNPGFLNMYKPAVWGGLALSPDGCKVAFFSAANAQWSKTRRVYIFNLCEIGG